MNGLRLELVLAGLVAGGLAFYVWKKGGLASAAAGAGAAAVNAAGAAASGAVGAIGATVGLPTPDETTTDPAIARWLMDNVGYFEASKWSSAGALFSAFGMTSGTGQAPAPGSQLAKLYPTASYDETERLAARYPAPWAAPPLLDINDPTSWGLPI